MQSPDYIADDFCQPQFSDPPIQVQEDRGAPLLNCAGLAIIRQLLERLGVLVGILNMKFEKKCEPNRTRTAISTL